MQRYNKTLLALLVSGMTVMGAASFAEARPNQPGYRHAEATPEMHQMMEKAYNDIAPLQLELRAKQQELTAKIYGGADDKVVQQLSSEVNALQKRLTDARVKMQQDFAKAGIPMQFGCGMMGDGMMGGRGFTGGCPGFGGHGRGHGYGFGGGMMPGPNQSSTGNSDI